MTMDLELLIEGIRKRLDQLATITRQIEATDIRLRSLKGRREAVHASLEAERLRIYSVIAGNDGFMSAELLPIIVDLETRFEQLSSDVAAAVLTNAGQLLALKAGEPVMAWQYVIAQQAWRGWRVAGVRLVWLESVRPHEWRLVITLEGNPTPYRFTLTQCAGPIGVVLSKSGLFVGQQAIEQVLQDRLGQDGQPRQWLEDFERGWLAAGLPAERFAQITGKPE